ncbi:sre G protein-coupled chemoreceptor domain-containing protein [Ditylenchus destructor]|nr:sre G protein-coupled chemoreceptor domain-containing protein [Ditylenchus destructor]
MSLYNDTHDVTYLIFERVNNTNHDLTKFILWYVEFGFHAVAIPLNLFLVLLLVKHCVIHTNLRVIKGAYAIALLIGSLARLPILVIHVDVPLLFWIGDNVLYLYYAHDMCICNHLFIMIPITVERLIATLRSRHYEKETTPYFGIISIIIMQICSFGLCLYLTRQIALAELLLLVQLPASIIGNIRIYLHPALPYILMAFTVAVFCLTVLCVMTLIALYRYNYRCYIRSQLKLEHSVQQKYQYCENIRTSAQLVPIVAISFICNMLITITWVLSFQFETLALCMKHTQDVILALCSVSIPVAAIFFHPFLRRAAICFLNRFSKSRVACELELEAFYKKGPKSLITGKQLILEREREKDIYFEDLRKSWS